MSVVLKVPDDVTGHFSILSLWVLVSRASYTAAANNIQDLFFYGMSPFSPGNAQSSFAFFYEFMLDTRLCCCMLLNNTVVDALLFHHTIYLLTPPWQLKSTKIYHFRLLCAVMEWRNTAVFGHPQLLACRTSETATPGCGWNLLLEQLEVQ